MGGVLIDILADIIESGAPRLAQAGKTVGKALGGAILSSLWSALKPSAEDFELQPWIRNLWPSLGGLLAKRNNVTGQLPHHALGGLATRASIFGEAGPEMAIPLRKTPRSLDLLNQTARILGVGGAASKVEISININAASGNPQQIGTAVKEVVIDIMEEYFGDKVRVAYD